MLGGGEASRHDPHPSTRPHAQPECRRSSMGSRVVVSTKATGSPKKVLTCGTYLHIQVPSRRGPMLNRGLGSPAWGRELLSALRNGVPQSKFLHVGPTCI